MALLGGGTMVGDASQAACGRCREISPISAEGFVERVLWLLGWPKGLTSLGQVLTPLGTA